MSDAGVTFDYFSGAESIRLELVKRWLNRNESVEILENELANRLLYPRVVPISAKDLDFDLAVWKESSRFQSRKYYNRFLEKLSLPEKLLERFPNLPKLAWACADVFNLPEITGVFVERDNPMPAALGTILRPKMTAPGENFEIAVGEKKYQIQGGSLMLFPAGDKRVKIHFQATQATLRGKNDLEVEVAGGPLGVMVDART